MNASSFSDTYSEARSRFTEAAAALGAELSSHEIETAQCPETRIAAFMPRPGGSSEANPRPLAAAHLPFFCRSELAGFAAR